MRPEDAGTYDDFCERYARHTASSLFNARYERPAMWSLVGDPRDLDVLDAGCATGEATALFHSNGARVVALDNSAAMVAWVARRFDGAVPTVRADLGKTLDRLSDASFDLVYSSLALHYVRDWSVPLREFARILRPGGRLLFSTHTPEIARGLVQNAHETVLVQDTWCIAGEQMRVEFWHRPFSAMLMPILDSDLTLRRVVEPRLSTTENFDAYNQDDVKRLQTLPHFIIFEMVREMGRPAEPSHS